MSVNKIGTSHSASIVHMLKTYGETNQRDFFRRFGPGQAKQIATDEGACLGQGSITSVEIGDCITVFGIEKIDNARDSLMGCHISNGTSVDEIKDLFEEYAFLESDYDLYIIGGNEHTTTGADSLLDRIHTAIDQFFEGKIEIVQELVHLNASTVHNYISANLHIDGTLMFCRH